jgi:hypothetical protein
MNAELFLKYVLSKDCLIEINKKQKKKNNIIYLWLVQTEDNSSKTHCDTKLGYIKDYLTFSFDSLK